MTVVLRIVDRTIRRTIKKWKITIGGRTLSRGEKYFFKGNRLEEEKEQLIVAAEEDSGGYRRMNKSA